MNSVIEVAMQDVNTVEATYSAVKTGAQKEFHLSDQELMIRSFHHRSTPPSPSTAPNATASR